MRSDYVVRGKNCNRCGGNIVFRLDEKSYCYHSCLQCGSTWELGHVRGTGYVPGRSQIVERMNTHPNGLLGTLFN
jgi:hypothetical protein